MTTGIDPFQPADRLALSLQGMLRYRTPAGNIQFDYKLAKMI
jgi:hypothetical protein